MRSTAVSSRMPGSSFDFFDLVVGPGPAPDELAGDHADVRPLVGRVLEPGSEPERERS